MTFESDFITSASLFERLQVKIHLSDMDTISLKPQRCKDHS